MYSIESAVRTCSTPLGESVCNIEKGEGGVFSGDVVTRTDPGSPTP